MFIYFIITYLFCSIFAAEIFGPMFKDMGLTSIYEYLERRFGKTSKMNGKVIRGLMTIEFIAQNIFYVGIVIYSPATALEVVTGLDKWLCVWLIGGICIFYTSIGGLKAVVWTDTFQICIMLSGYVAIISKASVDFGSFKNISEPYKLSENWVFDEFDWDPRIRHSFWTIIIGGLFGTWGNSFCCSQRTLSTVSSGINSMTTVAITDFIQPRLPHKSDVFFTRLSKLLTVLFGIACIGFAYIAANLGGVLQAALSVNGMMGGTSFAVFILGFFNPWAEEIGTIVGFLSGLGIAVWTYIGSTIYKTDPQWARITPQTISQCEGYPSDFPCTSNSSDPWCDSDFDDSDYPAVAQLYAISYLYLGTLGLVTNLVVGSLVSFIICRVKKISPNQLPKIVLFPALDRLFSREEVDKSPLSVRNVAFDDEEKTRTENPFDEDQTNF
ncbi:Oidioi.mRNA.OKI2018_I69.chr1.g340.t1.cds [Oikopleura dioica]|uniref:Oidioi.mRNA.OKI2018_I69.chr1.g340.t1.cds n=1 Tax=Oikopleura dioica TaxID=34765 RepID=A0ABN7SRQ3_OIKDI|nr:Oidioi.mRNA.OKI2018_I69.chr1.g340.t1.cds [Oikopleura dioica]